MNKENEVKFASSKPRFLVPKFANTYYLGNYPIVYLSSFTEIDNKLLIDINLN